MHASLQDMPHAQVGYSCPMVCGMTYNVGYNNEVDVSLVLDKMPGNYYTGSYGFEDIHHDWYMMLQRQNSSGGWDTIGTRSGYVAETSPSNRTFTGIAKSSRPLRIVVDFTYDSGVPNLVTPNFYNNSQVINGYDILADGTRIDIDIEVVHKEVRVRMTSDSYTSHDWYMELQTDFGYDGSYSITTAERSGYVSKSSSSYREFYVSYNKELAHRIVVVFSNGQGVYSSKGFWIKP